VADHPLRPATDRRLGRPLPCQLANRTRTPLSARALRPPLTSRFYAVLARVSPGYPPPKGRLSTRYSPVRRSTRVLLPGLARLACVKHAASVHSEPGSNSPVLFWRPLRDKSSSMPSASLILALFVLLVLLSPRPRLFSSRPRLTSKKSLLYFPYSVFKESIRNESGKRVYHWRACRALPRVAKVCKLATGGGYFRLLPRRLLRGSPSRCKDPR
jgi:hypothetical protein